MTHSREIYTPGYSQPTLRLMLMRTAAKHAAFFTPFLRPGMRLLECGCGPGTITIDLANLVAPGQVVGIDLEPVQLRSALDRGRQRQINVSFGVASIYGLPFSDGSFDAVFAHALFEHLREPVRALLEMRRVLRSSGLIGVRSPDWAGWLVHPPNPLIEQAFQQFKKIQITNGGNPHVGRTLCQFRLKIPHCTGRKFPTPNLHRRASLASDGVEPSAVFWRVLGVTESEAKEQAAASAPSCPRGGTRPALRRSFSR